MTLLVDELYPGIVFEQNWRLQETISMPHFRVWIYKQGVIQDGELVLEVWRDGELLTEDRIDHTEINENVPATYAHGYIRFDIDPMQVNHDRKLEWTEYTVKIYMDNHTRDTQRFIGTVREYERKKYDTYGTEVIDNEAPNDFVEPLGIEIFRWRN